MSIKHWLAIKSIKKRIYQKSITIHLLNSLKKKTCVKLRWYWLCLQKGTQKKKDVFFKTKILTHAKNFFIQICIKDFMASYPYSTCYPSSYFFFSKYLKNYDAEIFWLFPTFYLGTNWNNFWVWKCLFYHLINYALTNYSC